MNSDKLTEYLMVDKKEFFFQFQSHPNYPSALAFGDTLNFLGVKNDAYELEKEYWEELPQEFITIYKNEFALIKKETNKTKVISDEVKETTFDDVIKNSQKFVLLFEKNKENQTKMVAKNRFQWLLFALAFLFILVSVFSKNWWFVFYNALTFTGAYLFLEIFKNKLGTKSEIVNNFCGGTNTSSTKEDNCQKIFKSKDFEWFGLNFSDFGLIYFIALAFLGFILPNNSIIFKIFSSLALFSVVYSIYYQIKNKTFCRICALVIGILVIQVAVSFLFSNTFFLIKEALQTVFISVLAFFSIKYLKGFFMEKEKLKKDNMKNLRFKRNYILFKSQLVSKGSIDFKKNSEVFFFGNTDAPLHIDLVSNPYCGFCKKAHEIVEQLFENHKENVSLQLRFNITENEHEEYKKLISLFDAAYKTEHQLSLKIIKDWYEERDFEKLKSQHKQLNNADENLDKHFLVGKENAEMQLNFTPIILINGFQFPENYDIEDILYFIEDLLEDEEIINERQEFSLL